ncbi:OmpA family protein [Mucilaginibacter sp. UR6-11]|uniref:OmpA family protein n=1 Tax=Mucilaginibacter sp. UR6-11 TaxID=1435644 RepID=UPI001E32F678|nr:OmpA family protein [Mucilaginibacter sp. UR6-11]MCC8427003.1 OmpA family protein [Mucilaginibacter sp. UR6-11]
MRNVILLALLLFLTVFAYAQQQYSTTNTEAIKNFALANQSIDEHLYAEAIQQLQKAINADPNFVEAHAQLGDMMHLQKNNKGAVEEFKKVIAINPEFSRAVYLKAGDMEISEALYQDAIKHLQKYLTYVGITDQNRFYAQKLIKDCIFATEALQHPIAFKPINMGPNINTANDEYSPVSTADDKTIIYTRQIALNEDFYQSTKVNNEWQKAVYLSDKINTPNYNEGSESVSQDGKFLFFTGCNRPDGRGRCDIYVAQKKGDDWGRPFDLSPPVNTGGWESQPSISADGRTLYFVSNRKGGYGGYDIWKSTLGPKGWGEPENLGPNINTSFNEQSPFIHPDDSTLYFCSNGWPGMGNQDLFVSRLSKDGKWQIPKNLGYPINTNGDESGLSLTANGSYAFFSSNKLDGYGGFDIYTFELPLELRPRMVTYVKGFVSDAKTRQPLESAVEILALDDNRAVYQDYSSADRGDFLATIAAGKNYGLNISKPGYLFYSENFSLVGHTSGNPFNITVLLEPIEVGNKVILKNIFFDTNKYDLERESRAELQKLIEFLALNPTVHIEISGHTDNVGNDELNQKLSENRAKSVYNYLLSGKVDPARLVYKGYGKTQPIAPNITDEDRAKNRRTEFKITAK